MKQETNKTIVALDLPTWQKNVELVQKLGNDQDFYKVGLGFITKNGFSPVDTLVRAGKRIFLDLKLFDISNTVKDAVKNCRDKGVEFLTVMGDPHIVEAASSVKGDMKILAVTVLTSLDISDLHMNLYPRNTPIEDIVKDRASFASVAGADGFICSPHEIEKLRSYNFKQLIVTPGIRSRNDDVGDQKRTATREQALAWGADYVVVGRPIYNSEDPHKALMEL